MPILAMTMGFIARFVAKKNKLLANRKMIFLILLISVLLCVPALLGFFHYDFMPFMYIALQVIYLITGYYNVLFLKRYLQKSKNVAKANSFIVIFLFQFVIMFIGAALFSTVFNLCNEMKYGIWACTCMFPFLLPPLFWETYNKYMSIPPEIYKAWKYSENDETFSTIPDYDRLMVMEIELYKTLNDTAPMKIKAKAPDNISFGVWFKMFLTDYNYKFPLQPIEYQDPVIDYSWIFYVKRSFFLPRKYIDYDQTILQNKIKEKYTILAKRVSEDNSIEIK
jgi:hypothetical protein